MSDIIEQLAPAEVANPGTMIPGESAPAPETNEIESRAKAMGWVPKEQFRGDDSKWRDADEFVRRGEEELPVMRERNRDLSRKVTEFEQRMTRQEREFQERASRQERMAAMALDQQRMNLEGQWEAAKAQAVEIGDVSRYQQLNRDQRQSMQAFDQRIYEQVKPQPQPQNDRLAPEQTAAIESWQVQNPWYFSDQGMMRYAETVHGNLVREKPGMSLSENLAEVTRIVRENFPDKFGTSQGRTPNVEGGSGRASGGKRERGVADLPPEARSAAKEFVRAGAFKTEAEYAKSYWAMENT
jgi:hypothetical protein